MNSLTKVEFPGEIFEEIKLIRSEIESVTQHRNKRSLINLGGSILKFLFGTMDEEDRVNIEKRLENSEINNHNLINNSNKQIKINDEFQKRIQIIQKEFSTRFLDFNLTGMLFVHRVLVLEIREKLHKVKEIIEKIQNNILASKINVMANSVLTNREINKYNITFEKLNKIKLSVASYKDEIIFIISIPWNIVTFTKHYITSIPNINKEELIMKDDFIIQLGDKEFLYEETEYKNLQIYKNCLHFKNCKKQINKNKNIVIEITRGILLIKNGKLQINNTCNDKNKIDINENVLINFQNCVLNINSTLYENNNEIEEQAIYMNNPVLYQNMSEIFENKQINFEEISNLDEIEEKMIHVKKHINITYTIHIFIILLIIVVMLYLIKNKPVKICFRRSNNLKEGGVTHSPNPPATAANLEMPLGMLVAGTIK